MVRWRELSKEEKEKIVKEIRKLREEGYGFGKIAKVLKEKYSLEVSHSIVEDIIYKKIIRVKRDYIIREIKKGLKEGKNKEEIAQNLGKELKVWPYHIYNIVSAVEKMLMNPEQSSHKILTQLEVWNISPIGINYIKEKIGLPIIFQTHGDLKRIYEALKKGPLTTDEIKGMMKGKSWPGAIIDGIKKRYGVEILSEHIPFSGNEHVYFLPEQRERAITKATEEAFKRCESHIKRLRSNFHFDEEGEKALLYILSLPFVREDNEALRRLKNYKRVFNELQHNMSLKYIELDGKRYYSFWDYGLEGVKNLNELTKKLFM